jgi:hypothetical protein
VTGAAIGRVGARAPGDAIVLRRRLFAVCPDGANISTVTVDGPR